MAVWLTDRWLGHAHLCWACRDENQTTRAVLFALLGWLDQEGSAEPVALCGFAPFCQSCAEALLAGGSSTWQPPRLRLTLDALLAEHPLDAPCDLCDGGRRPPQAGPCVCRGGRRLVHGFGVGMVVVGQPRAVGGDTLVGPSPGPLFPTEVPYAQSGWASRKGDVQPASPDQWGGPLPLGGTDGPWDHPDAPPVETAESRLERRLARRGPGGPPRRPLRG